MYILKNQNNIELLKLKIYFILFKNKICRIDQFKSFTWIFNLKKTLLSLNLLPQTAFYIIRIRLKN